MLCAVYKNKLTFYIGIEQVTSNRFQIYVVFLSCRLLNSICLSSFLCCLFIRSISGLLEFEDISRNRSKLPGWGLRVQGIKHVNADDSQEGKTCRLSVGFCGFRNYLSVSFFKSFVVLQTIFFW